MLESKLHLPDIQFNEFNNYTSVGVFSDHEHTSVIPIALSIEPKYFVADSFHVKPLIASSQMNENAFLLHFSRHETTLYEISETCHHFRGHYKAKSPEMILFDLMNFTNSATRLLGISKSHDCDLNLDSIWKYSSLRMIWFGEVYADAPLTSVPLLRTKLIQEKNYRLIHEIRKTVSYPHSLTCDNLSLVMERAHLNKIRKLYISLEDVVQPGLMKDDVLDDLAEFCMDQGADVKVVTKTFLPAGKVLVAA